MSTVLLSNVATTTTSEQLRQFVEFCGKIDTIDKINDDTYKIVFVAPEASETALLLNGVVLEGKPVSVSVSSPIQKDNTANNNNNDNLDNSNVPHSLTTSSIHPDATTVSLASQVPLQDSSKSVSNNNSQATETPTTDIAQEYKPKSTIFAEYLSNGYVLGDQALQKAIQYDSQKGYSTKFRNFLSNLDSRYHVQDKFTQERTKAITSAENAHLFEKKSKLDLTFEKYFTRAKSTTYGSRLHDFYLKGVSDIKDIHEEAKRLAQIKSAKNQ
ncbi:uncharacterized protein ASCRUDRAFT_37280 [Ascoidea rubescens DSM 1968]|uniref:RRM domain-containing protein n=1 Tax=Ascoidea rubescens DSM 1968 TaxID=1344418 RepID=A0A1D2VD40_9ASCO|nr:hypothetical protein ASCRUDRAFT_37280 [Ascoidea rubescens DSM 1968]ODV59618.1 hypothetical protein ASCRUDRAFT_37280 [Ascoidea rubescens DSM 1968]